VGDPLDKAVDIGAIIAPVQLERIQRLVEQGVEEGAHLWQPSWACPVDGYFYPPTLFTEVSPAATIAQVEIFGPVLVAMTFRTPAEAVALANNTTYGLAASIWSESINLALDVARGIKAGTIWINCTNVFDAASGFGGYRESGFGREGGREGLYEYLNPLLADAASFDTGAVALPASDGTDNSGPVGARRPLIDRTPKLFIGGKQVRPDSGYSRPVRNQAGEVIGEVGEGNRKDLRNAVEAAHGAQPGWSSGIGHTRAQILYYIAENLASRAPEFAGRLKQMTGCSNDAATTEVERSIERLFTYAAWADKYDGLIHSTLARGMTLAVPEPIGVLGLICPDEYPLLGFISLVAPAVAMGNSVVVAPSQSYPLAATDFYTVLEASDVPGGVVNIVTGSHETLAKVLAEHDDIDGLWYFGGASGIKTVESASAGNMKRTWAHDGAQRSWLDAVMGEGPEFLRQATQVKNIWVPVGE
jgi:aldehyde dehydrogenase (NAD+)